MLNNQNPWYITSDEKGKFDLQFQSLNPVNGYITGNQAKSLFIKSNLPTDVLGKIWSLADYDNDGRMNNNEFSIAMHLINRRLEGLELPKTLPPSLNPLQMPNSSLVSCRNIPVSSIYCSLPETSQNASSIPIVSLNPINVTAATTITSSSTHSSAFVSYTSNMGMKSIEKVPLNTNVTNLTQDMEKSMNIPSLTVDDWSIPQAIKPRYRLQFNQQDRNKRGFLTGVEAKAILIQSGLSNNNLAQIWSLADIDQDGNLTCEEFCIAMHLVEQARAGRSLPSQLPLSLLPASYQRKNSSDIINVSVNSTSSNNFFGSKLAHADLELPAPPILPLPPLPGTTTVVELETVQGVSQKTGQTELDKRRAILEEQMRLVESKRMKERTDLDRQDKMRKENEKIKMAEVERDMEERLRRQAEERENIRRMESEKMRLFEMEKRRLDLAIVERRQEQNNLTELNCPNGNLNDILRNEKEKKQEILSRTENTQMSLESYKIGMSLMKENGDKLMDNSESLRDELEAAKAELYRCQMEKKNLEVQLQSNVQSDPIMEKIKSVQALKTNHKEKIKLLDKEIKELEQKMTGRGQKLAINKNKVRDLEKKVTTKLISDMKKLQSSVTEKKNAALAILKKQKEPKSAMSNDEKSGNDVYGKINPRSQNNDLVYYEALYPFEGRKHDEISFQVGDVIVTHINYQTELASGWLCGWLEKSSACGLFPKTYVRKLDNGQINSDLSKDVTENVGSASGNNGYSEFFNSNSMPKSFSSNHRYNAPLKYDTNSLDSRHKVICVARYPYEASVLGDLNIQPGDIIEVIDQRQGWWKGYNRTTNLQGLFPSNYVKMLNSEDMACKSNSLKFFSSNQIDDLTDSNLEMMNASQHSTMSINSTSSNLYSTLPDDNNSWSSYNAQTPIPGNPIGGILKPELAEVIVDFSPSGAEQIPLQKGQLVQVIEKSNSGWWRGEIPQGSQKRIGWFPGSYVCLTSSSQSIISESPYNDDSLTPPNCTTPTPMTTLGSNDTSSSTIDLNESQSGDYLITMYTYCAQNIDELSFEKNVILVLIERNETEWWMGRNLSTFQDGLFPVNYVRCLQQGNISDEEAMKEATQAASQHNMNVAGRPVSWYVEGSMKFNAILTEDEKRRQFYIRELIETEKVYYDDLQEVHQIFYEPIKKSNLLSVDELKSIFLNWSDLIPNSYNFFMALKIRKDLAGPKQPIQSVGDILLSNFPNFIVYVRFCSMQNQAIAKLQKKQQQCQKFKELCEQCESHLRCQKMPMTSYFLKPMQRITKYKLLVENILKHTDENHPDRSDMEEAAAAARSLCESVNDGVRERENSERLEWLQDHVQCDMLSEKLYFNSNTNCLGHRKLIYSGTLSKYKSSKELVGFLFNDFFLLATPCYNTNGTPFVFPLETSSKDKMQFKMYKKPIILNQVMISPGINSGGSTTSQVQVINDVFTVKEPNYDHILRALSHNDRDKWVDRLMSAATFYIQTENLKRECSMSSCVVRRTAGVGRLIVTIVEGINLRPSSNKESKSDPFCEVSLGNQLHRTKVMSSNLNPKWNTQMQFLIKNIDKDVLCLTVYNKDYFAPNDFLGRIEVSISHVVEAKRLCREPLEKRLKLMEVEQGELIVKLDLAMFKKN